jgi:hypothetical protein
MKMLELLRLFLTLGVIVGPLPNTIANGQTEDAVPVMANYNWILNQVNANAAPLNNPTFTGVVTIVAGTFTSITLGGVALNAFVDAETPSGTINGVGATGNAVFTLANAPSPAASLMLLHKDGTPYIAFGKDFTLAGLTITFVAASTPQTGDLLYASYRY